jgi:H+/Na+-translocating ferredoxin:NAD+ oxidoreductase subunit B
VTVLTAVLALGGLTFVLATLLLVAGRALYVEEDPRLDVVEALLPASNCGACGYPGCRAFAEALVGGGVSPANCTVSSAEGHSNIAALLGVAVGEVQKVVARLACAGGDNVARRRADYQGPATCISAAQVAGGGKDCYWGCLGFGDCSVACEFDAITMDQHQLPVVDEERCTACGDCVDACPKNLFSLQNSSNQLWVRCRNEEFGDGILEACEVGCTACGRCAVDAPQVVNMSGNLPVVDYTALEHKTGRDQGRTSIERCPTGAIVWLDAQMGDIRGAESARIIRQSARQETTS